VPKPAQEHKVDTSGLDALLAAAATNEVKITASFVIKPKPQYVHQPHVHQPHVQQPLAWRDQFGNQHISFDGGKTWEVRTYMWAQPPPPPQHYVPFRKHPMTKVVLAEIGSSPIKGWKYINMGCTFTCSICQKPTWAKRCLRNDKGQLRCSQC
jgi:hypothetical protein